MEGRKPKGLTVNTTVEASEYDISYSTDGYWDWEAACTCCHLLVSKATLASAGEHGFICRDCAEDFGYTHTAPLGAYKEWIA